MALKPDAEQNQQWTDLYQQLRTLLSAHGTESPFGRADFWLVDDNWGANLHKVSVFNIAFLTPELAKNVQELVARPAFENWGVMFALELEHEGQPVRTVPPEGIVVYADRIDEAWDRKRLKAVLGSSFAWDSA
jgi:hypothetical protein